MTKSNGTGYVTTRKGNTNSHAGAHKDSAGPWGMLPVTSVKFDMISVRPGVIFPKADFSFPHNFLYT